MDTIKTVTKQDLRDLILRCYKQCISEGITDLDISFTSIYIEVKIPKGQQYDYSADIANPAPLASFDDKISRYSFGNLKVITSYIDIFDDADGKLRKKVLSIDIACNYQIAE